MGLREQNSMAKSKNKSKKNNQLNNEIIIYESVDGKPNISVRVEDETVWLTQAQLAELFRTSRPNITMHIKNIFDEGELAKDSVCQDFLQTANDGKKYNTKYYNLDLIISLGYRVKSQIATHFRQWATARLREYIVKGFTMDDERLKEAGGGNYWKELLGKKGSTSFKKVRCTFMEHLLYPQNSPSTFLILNIQTTTLQKWKMGINKPSGTAARLLQLIDKKGKEVIQLVR